MRWRAQPLIAAGLALAGTILLALYSAAAFGVIDAGSEPRAAAGIAGLAFGALVAGGLVALSSARRLTFPPSWAGVLAFSASIAVGFGLVRWDEARSAEPFVALLASIALVAVLGALLVRWAPARQVDARVVLAPLAWGIAGATTLAMLAQLIFALGLFAGVLAGLAWHDSALPRELFNRLRDESFLNTASDELILTPTVMVGVVALLAIAAPLTEELTKLLGVALVFRRVESGPYTAFLAGAFVGLGFAAIETLAIYGLPAGESWPAIVLLRAPVAIMHVTASAIAGYGWYRQRAQGGLALLGSYAAAVGVHAAWNGTFVALMMIALNGAGENPDEVSTGAALAFLVLAGGMLALLVGCLGWLVRTARRLGSGHAAVIDRTPPVSSAGRVAATFGPIAGLISR